MAEAEEGGGSVVPSGVKQKIGPLPLWAWAVVVAGLVGVLFIVRKQQQSSAGTSTDTIGQAASTNAGDGINGTSTDPMSLGDLINALNQLDADIKNQKPAGNPFNFTRDPSTGAILTDLGWWNSVTNKIWTPGDIWITPSRTPNPISGSSSVSTAPQQPPYSPPSGRGPNLQNLRSTGGLSTALLNRSPNAPAGLGTSGVMSRLGR